LEKIDLAASKIRTVIVAGEPGGSIPSTRERLQMLWPGARVFDHHGMTETGPVTYECPAQPCVLHILESGYFAEIIDSATGRAAAPGVQGELVLTNLGRAGSPLLRYRTGDLVKCGMRSAECGIDSPCRCGRHDLALEGGILGRVDDMVVVRGVNVYPSAVEEIVRTCGGVAEYRVEVSHATSLAELRLEVEPQPDCVDLSELKDRLEKGFLKAFALRVPVTIAAPGTLPRFEMKALRWVRNLSRPEPPSGGVIA
jgi:phenylacetate-CoA ligase